MPTDLDNEDTIVQAIYLYITTPPLRAIAVVAAQGAANSLTSPVPETNYFEVYGPKLLTSSSRSSGSSCSFNTAAFTDTNRRQSERERERKERLNQFISYLRLCSWSESCQGLCSSAFLENRFLSSPHTLREVYACSPILTYARLASEFPPGALG